MRELLKRLGKSVGWSAKRLALVLAIGCVTPANHATASDEALPKPAYRLGVFPYLPALTIDRLFGPLAESFSLELDRLVKLRTKSTFESFADAIEDQSYDILFVHPFFFVDAVDLHGYQPLARLDRSLNAVLVAPEDGDVSTLDDLVGETIGLPPKLAAVSKLIKTALMDEGLRPGLDIGIRHFRNKASCLQATESGAVAACGVPKFILTDAASLPHRPLRVVFGAPPVSHFAFAVHDRVSDEERARLEDVILSLGDGRIEGFGSDKHFVLIGSGDYASIRAKEGRLKTLAQR